MIPRSQGHCYLRHLHCHHHCPVWPETGGNPRCCPGPQGLDLSRSRNRRLASQGWHKSRGWRHRCHPQRWERATCGMVAGWPAYHPGTPLSILVTRSSRPLEASGPPCWLGRACGGCRGNKGGLVRRTACSLVPGSPHPRLPAQGLLWPNVQTLLPSQGTMGPASVFSEIASPCLQKSPLQAPLHNPGHFWFQTFSRMILERNKTRNALVCEQLSPRGKGGQGKEALQVAGPKLCPLPGAREGVTRKVAICTLSPGFGGF